MARGTSFRYDAVGNRTRRSVSVAGVSETENYVNDSLSNRFQSSSIKAGWLTLQSRALTHSDSGNRDADTASGIALNLDYAMTYDATDRLASVSDGATVLGEYLHNAMGQRVSKTRSTGAVRHYIYDLSGRLIAEAGGATGAMVAEYIALEGINLAYITTTDIYWVHADHLGTPQMLTDAAGAEAWSGLYAPFGMLLEESGTLDFNLRFPGQYHDAETEYYYNYYRTYDPTSGRYVESDPIGLRGGWNTYGYVGGNPVRFADFFGLRAGCTTVFSLQIPLGTIELSRSKEVEFGLWELVTAVPENSLFFTYSARCAANKFVYQWVTYEERVLSIEVGYCENCGRKVWFFDSEIKRRGGRTTKEIIETYSTSSRQIMRAPDIFSAQQACAKWVEELNNTPPSLQ